MKRRIILFFIVLFAISASGAIVFILHIKKSSDEFTRLIELHEVEDLRNKLIIRVQAVQSDLYTIGTSLAQNLDTMTNHVTALEQTARKCRSCHHSAGMDSRLEDLQLLIERYQIALSHYLTISADEDRVEQSKLEAVEIGNLLYANTEKMSIDASAKLGLLTKSALSNVKEVKTILFISMFSTIVFGIFVAIRITGSITRPVKKLLNATNMIAAGELGHTIVYEDGTEFGLLARNFNAMSLELRQGYEKLKKKIEEQEKTEKALVKSEAFLNTIIDNIQNPFYIIDRNYTIILINDVYARIVDKSEHDWVGQKCYTVIKQRDAICDDCLAEKTFSTGDSCVMEYSGRSSEGHEIWSEQSTYPIFEESDGISHIIQYVRDITPRKIYEQSLRHANAELEEGIIERTKELITANEQLLEEIAERREIEAQLKQTSRDWRITFDSTNDMMMFLDHDFNIKKMNAAACLFLGKPFGVLLGKNFFTLFPNMKMPLENNPLEQMQQAKKHIDMECYFAGKDVWMLVSADPVLDPAGHVIGSVFIMRDVTEQKTLQSQLMQVQKMDSIGRLAGGVAHDFNNILSSIIGFADLTLMKLPEDSEFREHLDIVKESGYKAAELTRQLLAFSRKQVLKMEVINICNIIQNMTKMLSRIVREDIVLKLRMASPTINIMADPVQIEQVLLNLVINARDAMPMGGDLIIAANTTELDGSALGKHEHIIPGLYAMLSISDTGIGMNRDLQERIFEPFFTTKETGKGTGLGLSTVYGIVKQHNGHIYVYSEKGKGTTFKIYLPAATEEMEEKEKNEQVYLQSGRETILVVDDDPSIRRLIRSVLQPLGYRYLEASSGKEALQIATTCDAHIDILLTDVIMPETNGRELAAAFCSSCPETSVIFMSGYADDALAHHGVLEAGVELMEKPIIPHKLAGKLREVLDRKQQC
jgi:PAS domain S-box-containing protein